MKSDLLTIIKKEFARFFGDKRMVLMALMPGLIIYLMYSFMGDGMSKLNSTEEDYVYEVKVVNLPQCLSTLKAMDNLSLTEVTEAETESIKEQITDGDTDLLVVFPEKFDEQIYTYDVTTATEAAPNVEIFYNSASNASGGAYGLMVGVLEQLEEALSNRFDVCRGETEYDLASDEDISAMFISMIMPMLIMTMLFTGCLSAASESIAGEKERGTIATLLVTPMKRSDLALGKIISLSGIGLLSGMSSFIGIMLSLPKLMGGLENVSFGYTAGDYAVLFLIIVTTTLIIVGLISVVSSFANSVKEATNMTSPIMILVMLISLTNMMSDGMPKELYWYLIPVYNTVQCMNGIFSMDYQMLPVVITAVSNALYAGVLVVVLTKMFNSERIMFSK